MNALDTAIKLLQDDPASRRAVVHIHGNNDLYGFGKDIPCPIAIEFLIRDGKLEMTTMMRSQSITMVLPYDLIVMTLLHEYVSVRLHQPVGRYTHFCVSAHIYEDELERSNRILEEKIAPSTVMPRMEPTDFSKETLQYAARLEEQTRLGNKTGEIKSLSSPFWDYVGNILNWQSSFFFSQQTEQKRD